MIFVTEAEARTIQKLMDDARIPLNDPKDEATGLPAVFQDAELLIYVNAAFDTLKARRPDLFYGQYPNVMRQVAATDLFPLDDTYYTAIADYVTGRAMMKDDEHALKEKGALFFALAGMTSA